MTPFVGLGAIDSNFLLFVEPSSNSLSVHKNPYVNISLTHASNNFVVLKKVNFICLSTVVICHDHWLFPVLVNTSNDNEQLV